MYCITAVETGALDLYICTK